MSLPLSILLKELEASPVSVIPILSTLHHERSLLSKMSKVDLKHLTSRTLNLCRSPIPYNIWCGVNIISVLIDSTSIIGSEGSVFLTQLLKILESSKSSDKRVFKSTVDCLNKLCDNIRGKPTLTREILTPNLSAIFSAYMEKFAVEPVLTINSLKTLIQHHPTTSRPFANKIRAKLLEFVGTTEISNYPVSVKDVAFRTLATLPIVEKEGPDQCWRKDVDRIFNDIASTLSIYESFFNVADDEDLSSLMRKLSENLKDNDEIFPLLRIDVNEPASLLQISERLELLFGLLKAYVTSATQFTVVVPIGRLVKVLELACSINSKFLQFKRDIRDNNIKEIIQGTLLQCHQAAVLLLLDLPSVYFGSLLPHLPLILAFLELLIFFKGKRLDHEKILIHESFYCDLLICVNGYLSLVGHFQDHATVTRFVEVALLLVEPRSEASQTNLPQNKSIMAKGASRKRSKKTASTPLADLLSHQHLFEESIPESTKAVVFQFLQSVLSRVTLSATQYNKLMRYVLIEAIKLKDSTLNKHVTPEIRNILIQALLNPASQSASALPLLSSLMWDEDLVSVFNNPRFPPLAKLVKVAEQVSSDEEDSETDEPEMIETTQLAVESEEPSKKKHKIDDSVEDSSISTNETSTNVESIFSKESNKRNFVAESEVTSQNGEKILAEVPKEAEAVQVESDDDEGSEIDIPELDIDVDSD